MVDAVMEMMPHGHCYLWMPELVWLHVISDAIIFLAYVIIPILLVYIVYKRGDIEFDWMFWAFGLFIILCGFTHAVAVATVWQPTYWFQGALKGVTAVVSIVTAYLLWKLIPAILNIPSPSRLQQEIDNTQKALADLEYTARQLNISHEDKDRLICELNESRDLINTYIQHAGFGVKQPINDILGSCDKIISYVSSGNYQDAKDATAMIKLNTRILDDQLDRVLRQAVSSGEFEQAQDVVKLTEVVDMVRVKRVETLKSVNYKKISGMPPIIFDTVAADMIIENILFSIARAHTEDQVDVCVKCTPIGFYEPFNSAAWCFEIIDYTKPMELSDNSDLSYCKFNLIRTVLSAYGCTFKVHFDDEVVFKIMIPISLVTD